MDAQGMLPGHNWHVPARPREEDGEEAEVALRDTPWRVVAAEKAAVRPQSIWVPWIRSLRRLSSARCPRSYDRDRRPFYCPHRLATIRSGQSPYYFRTPCSPSR